MKSCCDEYCSNFGCNQGRSCPARQACELPEAPKKLRYTQTPAKRSVPTWFKDVSACAIAVLAIVWLTAYYGPSLDTAPDSPAVTDAQAAAMHEYLQELQIAKACRFERGESLVRHTADGGFVCLPRNSKRLSSNP